MEATDPISPEVFLAAVNGEYSFGHKRREMAVWSGLKLATQREYDRASELFVERLRKLTDDWLRTGIKRDGVEVPKDRKPTFDIRGIVTTYLNMHPAMANFHDQYRAAVPFQIDELWTINFENAQTGVVETPFGPRRVLLPGGAPDTPLTFVEAEAVRLFVGMLFTPYCKRIAKCRNERCGKYYLLTKPRPKYSRGTMCAPCRRKTCAENRTAERRAERQAELAQLAMQALESWGTKDERQRAKLGPLRDYIAAFVNRRTRHKGITAKWVTRNKWTANLGQIKGGLQRATRKIS
jgi:hypothetical protein